MQVIPKQISRAETDAWNELLLTFPHASYRQSMPWEYATEADGREITTFVFESDGGIVAGAHYSLKRSAGKIITIADVMNGFLFRDDPDPELLAFVLEHFEEWAKSRKACYSRITPWLPMIIAGEKACDTDWANDIFRSRGYVPIKPGRHTYWIDLTKSEDELLAAMSKSTRKRMRRASRDGVRISKYTEPKEALFEAFWDVYKREGQISRSYLKSKSRVKLDVMPMLESGLGNLYFVEYQGQTIYVSFVSNFGLASTIHSGMRMEAKNHDCPSPGHLLRWQMMLDMKAQGNKIHDMGFCPGPEPVEGHPYYGIWAFKHSFGGDHVEYLPVYGKVLRPICGRLFQRTMKHQPRKLHGKHKA